MLVQATAMRYSNIKESTANLHTYYIRGKFLNLYIAIKLFIFIRAQKYQSIFLYKLSNQAILVMVQT